MNEEIVTIPVERTIKLNRPAQIGGATVTHVQTRMLFGGDLSDIGWPYSYRRDGTRILDDDRMSRLIAAATGLPLFMVRRLSFADWFNLAAIVSEDGGIWEVAPEGMFDSIGRAEELAEEYRKAHPSEAAEPQA